jgi:hypothetical protein
VKWKKTHGGAEHETERKMMKGKTKIKMWPRDYNKRYENGMIASVIRLGKMEIGEGAWLLEGSHNVLPSREIFL